MLATAEQRDLSLMNVTASSSCSEHCSFLGEAYFEDATSGRCYYRNVELDGECFSVGDCVACLLEDETSLNGQSISAAEIVHIWRCGTTTVCEEEADKDDEEDECAGEQIPISGSQ